MDHEPASPAPIDLCPEEDETDNRYRDDDGCPDEPIGGIAYFANGLRPVAFTPGPLPRKGAAQVPFMPFSLIEDPYVGEVHPHATLGRFVASAAAPRSTFAAANDTAAAPLLRRFLTQGALPPIGAVRIESLVDYYTPTSIYPLIGLGAPRLDVFVEVGPCPWSPGHRLARIHVEAPPRLVRPRTTILMLDRSPSMSTPERLPMVKHGFSTLLDTIAVVGREDRVAVIAFDREEQLVLPPTDIAERATIDAAIAGIRTGAPSGYRGRLDLAHALADKRRPGEHVHIILVSDGAAALWYPRERPSLRRPDTSLTVIGVGDRDHDNYTLGQFAADNDGQLRYLDSAAEADRLFHLLGLQGPNAAEDLQFQAVFDPAVVARWHLVGHGEHAIAAAEFRRDTPPAAAIYGGPQHPRRRAAELAGGQSMSVLYELVPTGSTPVAFDFTVRARIGGRDRRIVRKVRDTGVELAATSSDFRFVAAVAELGLLVQGGPRGQATLAQVRELAAGTLDNRPRSERADFLALVDAVEPHFATRAAHWAAADAWLRDHPVEALAPVIRAAAEIPASSLLTLRGEAMRMAAFGVRVAVIGGHDGREGRSPDERAAIAMARAEAVKRYLIEVMGHPPDRYEVRLPIPGRAPSRHVTLESIVP